MDNNIPQLIYSLAVLMLLVVALFSRKGFAATEYFKYAVIWAVFILFAVFMYSLGRDSISMADFSPVNIKSRVMAELYPATPVESNGTLQISKSENSHYYIDISVEGKTLTFLIDTGATYNVISVNHLKAVGYNTNSLDYIFPVKTGNGMVKLAYASLKTNILGHDLGYMSFMVTKDENLDIAVLGMNFLDKFDGFKVEHNRMILELR